MNIEGEENNKLLDEEDTQRTNLNSKYVSLTRVKYSDSLILSFLSSILVKYDLILRYEARLNALGAFSFDKSTLFDRQKAI